MKASSAVTNDDNDVNNERDLEEQTNTQVRTRSQRWGRYGKDLQLNGTKTSRGSKNRPVDQIIILKRPVVAAIIATVPRAISPVVRRLGRQEREGDEPEDEEEDVEGEDGPVVVGLGDAGVSADEPYCDDEGDDGL